MQLEITALDNKDYAVIETVTITLDYEIKFATCYMCPITYDLMGNRINDIWSVDDPMKNIFVNMFPENGKAYILISWLKSDSQDFQQLKEQFVKLQKNKELLINTLNNLVACESDNFAISPEIVEGWDMDTKEFFLSEFVSFILQSSTGSVGEIVEKNLISFPCKFNLFK